MLLLFSVLVGAAGEILTEERAAPNIRPVIMGDAGEEQLDFMRNMEVMGVAAHRGEEKIIGGYECWANSKPWQVSLNLGYHVCGGSLISDQWVVSAAHCWYYSYAMLIVLGDHDIQVFEGTEKLMKIDHIVQHPSYDSQTLDHNIMLIKLYHPVPLSKAVKPIPLPTACPAVGTNCVVSGWGSIHSYIEVNPPRLQCLNVPILSHEDCAKFYRLTSTMVCAGYFEGGRDACEGDSGGPLVCNGELQGIVSWGYGCAERNYPVVYTKVCVLLPWIKDTLALN